MSDEKIATREEKLAPLIAKAWQDETYKKELLADPKAVLQKEFGVEIPAEISVEVLEESPTKLYIVLPAKPTGELSDEQLEAVAGGFCVPLPGIILAFTPAIVAGFVTLGVVGGGLIAGAEVGKRRGW